MIYSNNMQITLFGGSFNPPHLGHLLVISQAFELIDNIDQLWVMPCFRHTFDKNLAPSQDRLLLTKALLKNLDKKLKNKVFLQTIEIDQQLSGETYETLQILKEKFPKNNFSFLMGADQLPGFKKWGSWQKLLNQMPFYIYPRNGYVNNLEYKNMRLLKSQNQIITNLSSTLIRERVKNKLSLNNLTPTAIINYINKHHLYELST